jgi:murein L,D-transpeptidase YafK
MVLKSMVFVLFCGSAGTRLLGAEDVPLSSSAVADKVIVLKSERKLMLMKNDKVLKTYRIALGTDPLGAKTRH